MERSGKGTEIRGGIEEAFKFFIYFISRARTNCIKIFEKGRFQHLVCSDNWIITYTLFSVSGQTRKIKKGNKKRRHCLRFSIVATPRWGWSKLCIFLTFHTQRNF